MEEDLFKKMMDRWGVRPSKGRSAQQESEPEPTRAAHDAKHRSPAPPPVAAAPVVDREEEAFQRAMGYIGVRPLALGLDPEQRPGEALPTRSVTPEEDQRLFLEALEEMQGVVPKDLHLGASSPKLQRLKTVKQAAPGATLDLHGLKLEEALLKLAAFVTAHFAASTPTVMVITGKGIHSKGGTSVLKPAVEKWILERGKRFIARYGEAPRAYGGRGAFVLYLRAS